MHRVVATLSVRVPLGATGGLADGAERIVERITAVERVEDATVQGLDPGLNDTTVVLKARVTLRDGDDPESARRTLADGVGVETVDAVEPDPPPATAATP